MYQFERPFESHGEATLSSYSVLILPGWNGSGPEHWQALWERENPAFRRVEQDNWKRPDKTQWLDRIEAAILAAPRPALLVAHSLGCLAVAHLAGSGRGVGVAGGLLVAPPWLWNIGRCPAELTSFREVPYRRLPFPSTLVASDDDPYLPIKIGRRMANAWGSHFVNAGKQGHINVESGHGAWPDGRRLLAQFVSRLTPAAHERSTVEPVFSD
jgi:hypothetical protein